MLKRSVRIKRNISKVAIDKIIKGDSQQTMDWLLQEYERRDKELLELEKLSYALLPVATTITALVIRLTNYPINMRFALAYYCFCGLLVVFSIPFVQKVNNLKSHLSNLEADMNELSQKNIWVYHTATPEKSILMDLLGNKIASGILFVVTAILMNNNILGEKNFYVVCGFIVLTTISLLAQTIKPFKHMRPART